MRILQVGPIPPEIGGRTVGGVATHVWDLSRHLVKRGHDVAILADNFPNPPEIPVIKEGVRIYGFSKTLVLKHLPSVLLSPLGIYKLKKHFGDLMGIIPMVAFFSYYKYVFRHFNPDVIHVHHLESRFPFAYFVSKNMIPIVTTVHSLHSVKFSHPTLSQRYRKLIRDNLKLSQNLIFVSRFVESEFRQYIGEFKGNSWVVYNPIDTKKFAQINKKDARVKLGIPSDVPIVLFVGSLSKRKGIYTLLEATKILKEKEVNLKVIIIGDGSELNNIKHYISENKLDNIVTILKRVATQELLLYYNAADLFVMPSFSEGFALAYIEAMLYGVPTIGTESVANESIPSENYGFVTPPGDAKSLVEVIEKGLRKKWDKEKIIEYARSFSFGKRIENFEKIYRELLKR